MEGSIRNITEFYVHGFSEVLTKLSAPAILPGTRELLLNSVRGLPRRAMFGYLRMFYFV